MKIIIVDDNKTFREGIKYFLERCLNYDVIEIVDDGAAFLKLKNVHTADIILMDIQMPQINGIHATKRVLWDMNYLKIIAITMYNDNAYLTELIEAGFKGYVIKNQIYEELQKAIETVASGKLYFPSYIKLSSSHNIKHNNF